MSGQKLAKVAGPTVLVAVVLLAVLAAWSSTLGNRAHATSETIGLDFNTSGTPANGAYGALPTFENCNTVSVGGTVSIDLYALNLSTLVAFGSHIQYNPAYVKVTAVNVNMFMNSQVGSAVANDSDPVLPDTDGLYWTAAHDTGNISGDNGSGVLARITFQGVASGTSTVSIPLLDYEPNGLLDTGALLRKADGSLVNDTSPADGFFDGAWNPGPGAPTGTIAVQTDSDGDGVPSSNCTGGPVDNCPTVSNPTQADADNDGVGDACDGDTDGDFYWDVQENAMGSNPNSNSSTPEICDGVDNDADGQTDEGFNFAGTSAPDCTEAGLNSDGDGSPNTSDTDDDNDGLSDTFEAFARTDTLRRCANPMTQYIWWAETSQTGSSPNSAISITDVTKFIPYFGSSAANPATKMRYNKRYDWNADNTVSILDVTKINQVWAGHCP